MPDLIAGNETRCRRTPAQLDAMVMDVLRSSPQALSAYEIAGMIGAQQRKFSPTQAYRSLTRLMARSQVVRLEGLNAFCHLEQCRQPIVYCRQCKRTTASGLHDAEGVAVDRARLAGFSVRAILIEIAALCRSCSPEPTR